MEKGPKDQIEQFTDTFSEFENNQPGDFIIRFMGSDIHNRAFAQFLEGKSISPLVSEKQRRATFYNLRPATDALLDFYLSEDKKFHYEPDNFSEDARKAMDEYMDIVRKTQTATSREEMESLDHERSLRHLRIADELVKDGVVPTIRMGRMLARIILVDRKIEGIDFARSML